MGIRTVVVCDRCSGDIEKVHQGRWVGITVRVAHIDTASEFNGQPALDSKVHLCARCFLALERLFPALLNGLEGPVPVKAPKG